MMAHCSKYYTLDLAAFLKSLKATNALLFADNFRGLIFSLSDFFDNFDLFLACQSLQSSKSAPWRVKSRATRLCVNLSLTVPSFDLSEKLRFSGS